MYAEVIVDIKTSNTDRIFDYEIPKGMKAEAGMRVTVNFNRRIVEGLIVGIKEETSYKPDKIKTIIAVKDKTAVITENNLKLAKWMKDRYLCLMVEALRCFIPVNMSKDLECKHVEIKLNVSQSEIAYYINKYKNFSKQVQILRYLLDDKRDSVSIKEINKMFGQSKKTLDALALKGLISRIEVEDENDPFKREYAHTEKLCLTKEQDVVLREISRGLDKSSGFFLLRGVTGSGKTEIYLQAIDYCISLNKQAIVLVPEISLTPQTVERFKSRFGLKVAIMHSRLSESEKIDQWKKIRDDKVDVVIGVRSAVFAPTKRLGLIIIDEEHESTYKQNDQSPKYDAREVAGKRCEIENAVLVLASATPSVVNYYKAEKGRYKLLTLEKRVNGLPMPDVQLVDMREELKSGNRSMFSRKLYSEIKNALDDKRQIILFLNRRGYSTFVSCRNCGLVMKCPHCDISLTYHINENKLICHYCGYTTNMPVVCPKCKKNTIRQFGIGTEKVEKEIKRLFPNARTIRMDLDTTSKKGSYEDIYNKFKNGEKDILIGTQMISKGLDFQNVTLVGVIIADTSLNIPDYKSSERTFQLITQVSGRAGRGGSMGRVIVQTYYPEHYSLQYAKNHDYVTFYNKEVLLRNKVGYPPFSEIAEFIISGKDENRIVNYANKLYDIIVNVKNIYVFKPVKAILYKYKDKYRWHVMMKCSDSELLRNSVKLAYEKIKKISTNCVITYNIGV